MNRFRKWIATGLIALSAVGIGSGVALGTTQYGNVFNAYAPTNVLGTVRGQGDYQRSSATWNRFQIRLLKDGVQKGSIVTYSAPTNANYRGQASVNCLLGAGTWKTQIRGVSTGGTFTVWDTSAGANLTCG